MFDINKLGQEVFQDYIVEDIVPESAVDMWHHGSISIFETNINSYSVLFFSQPEVNIYIPMFCGCGKKVNIFKRLC